MITFSTKNIHFTFNADIRSQTYSQSLSLPHMGNGVQFFLLTDIAYLSEPEFQGIG